MQIAYQIFIVVVVVWNVRINTNENQEMKAAKITWIR